MCVWKTNQITIRSPSTGAANKKNKSNKTYTARLTRWLYRLAHFDMNIKHFAGKLSNLMDYLNRKPIAKQEPIENYDEDYVNNSYWR